MVTYLSETYSESDKLSLFFSMFTKCGYEWQFGGQNILVFNCRTRLNMTEKERTKTRY